MTKKRATESSLAEMHGKLADVFNTALTAMAEMQRLHMLALSEPQQVTVDFEEEDMVDVPAPIYAEPSPAFLTVAARFLKDNNITVQPEENTVSEIAENLEALRKNRPTLVRNIAHEG